MPKCEHGKAPVRGQVRGTTCRNRKNFAKVMAVLFARNRWSDLLKRAEEKSMTREERDKKGEAETAKKNEVTRRRQANSKAVAAIAENTRKTMEFMKGHNQRAREFEEELEKLKSDTARQHKHAVALQEELKRCRAALRMK